MNEKRIIIAGSGGQGIFFAGEILIDAAMRNGINVSMIPCYGPEMRGGTAHTMIILSEKEIFSTIVDTVNILISLNLPSLDKFVERVEEKAIIIHNSTLGKSIKDMKKFNLYNVPMTEEAANIGSVKVTNIIALGALNKLLKISKDEYFIDSIKEKFGKDKTKLIDLNIKAFEIGKRIINI